MISNLRPNDLESILWTSVERYRILEDKVLSDPILTNLSAADVRAIYRIGLSQSERMSTLAKRLRLTVGTLTLTIDRLVEKDLVSRQKIERDRRVVEVRLTEKGQEVFEEIKRLRKSIAEQILTNLDEAEREELKTLLFKMVSVTQG